MNIYILGTPLVSKDATIISILPQLQECFPHISFKHIDPTEGLPSEDHLIIIDAAEGINSITLLDESNIDNFTLSPTISVHDFDLAFELKLQKKVGELQDFTIIAIPVGMEKGEAVEGVIKEIEKLNIQ